MAPIPGEIFLDGTTGAGGHAAEIAARIGPRGLLVCADADPSMLEIAGRRLSAFPWVRLVHADFADLDALREAAGGKTFDGALLDLGISSLQLDDPARGMEILQSINSAAQVTVTVERNGQSSQININNAALAAGADAAAALPEAIPVSEVPPTSPDEDPAE